MHNHGVCPCSLEFINFQRFLGPITTLAGAGIMQDPAAAGRKGGKARGRQGGGEEEEGVMEEEK